MTRIIADISVSLDGYVTGPDPGPGNGLGTGLFDAIATARERAELASGEQGEDLDVIVMGGGATVGSALAAGLVDALSLHLAPVILGAGTQLFTGGMSRMLIQRSVTATSTAAHLVYDPS